MNCCVKLLRRRFPISRRGDGDFVDCLGEVIRQRKTHFADTNESDIHNL
jgi:hypothetical protein